MKLIYVANARMPTEKAHGLQILKMCEAFADIGLAVELVVPWRFNSLKDDPFVYYDTKPVFKIKRLPALDLVRWGRLGFWLHNLTFSLSVCWYLLWQKADLLYSRDSLSLYFASFLTKNMFWETHDGKHHPWLPRVLRRIRGMVAITAGLKDFYGEYYQLKAEKILVAPSGVDLKKFDLKLTKRECREKLGFAPQAKIIVYTGHLYAWKGAQILADAAEYLPDCQLVFVGGTEADLRDFRARNQGRANIHLLGQRPHREMPFYLGMADVLVLPNSAQSSISREFTSPLKLFEYLASSRPLVAADIPSLREILSESTAVLVPPDDPPALAAGIQRVLQDDKLAQHIASQGLILAAEHTWAKRAAKINDFMRTLL